MVSASETGAVTFLEIPTAAEAAAKAINAAGGVQGHPIKIITCDTTFTPNGSARCARKAVSDKVAASVGAADPYGDTYMPILAAGGVPAVANFSSSPSETTSPFSYPIVSPALQFVAAGVALKAAGASSVRYLGPNVPTFSGLAQLVKGLLPAAGPKFNGVSLFPITATDYTQYVTDAYGSGAGGVDVTLTTAATVPALVNAVQGGGFSFVKTPTALLGTTFRPSILKGQLANKLNGVYVVNSGETPTDTSLPGIKTFHDEIAAAGKSVEYDDAGLPSTGASRRSPRRCRPASRATSTPPCGCRRSLTTRRSPRSPLPSRSPAPSPSPPGSSKSISLDHARPAGSPYQVVITNCGEDDTSGPVRSMGSTMRNINGLTTSIQTNQPISGMYHPSKPLNDQMPSRKKWTKVAGNCVIPPIMLAQAIHRGNAYLLRWYRSMSMPPPAMVTMAVQNQM